jgi:hypothetical protein
MDGPVDFVITEFDCIYIYLGPKMAWNPEAIKLTKVFSLDEKISFEFPNVNKTVAVLWSKLR